MGNNRFNKPTPQPVDYTPKKKEQEEVKLNFKPCIVCGKQIGTGYYGSWGDGGTCSKACESIQEDKRNDYGYPNGLLWRES